MNKPRIAGAALVVLACAAAHPVRAGTAAEVTSRVFGIDKSQALELDGKRRFTLISTDEIVVTDGLEDTHPLKNLSGSCAGSLETAAGAYTGGGYCVYANPQGGKWLLTWVFAADGLGGTYRLAGTDGNALGWKGAGSWGQNIDFAHGRYVQTWLGTVDKP